MKTVGVGRTLLGVAALCWVLVSAGCGVTVGINNNPPVPAVARIDWGMSIAAGSSDGLGQFPAKFTFDASAAPDCVNDYVAYNTSVNFTTATPGPNIVAFNHLYSTQGVAGGLCNQDGPSVYWAYFTGITNTEGAASNSPVLSLDGTKVAYIENAGAATLRIVKWKAGQGTVASPASVDVDITGSAWSTCPAGSSCVASLVFTGSTRDVGSPPFVDYNADVIYVGDDNGVLHKFTGVFNGTPAEVTVGWPIELITNTNISGPVFDHVSGNIYIGDSTGTLRYVREVGSSVGTCAGGGPATPPCKGATTLSVGTGGTVVDAPIVDSTTGMVFAVNGTETANHGTLLQASTDFVTSVVSVNIGGTGAGSAMYGGAFDNTYINSSPGSIAGHMYVCGKDNSQTDSPAVYRLSFNSAGVLSTGLGTPLTSLVGTTGEACSPVTEFFNAGTSTDWIFFSIGNNANTAGTLNPIPAGSPCQTGGASGAGCIISVNLTTNPSWPPTSVTNTAPLPGNATGASSGIVIDNVGTSPQTSNIYFSLIANSVGSGPGLPSCNTTAGVGCAIKLTQSGFN